MSNVKIAPIRRGSRPWNRRELDKQIDQIRAKIDEIIFGLSNLETTTNTIISTGTLTPHAKWTGHYGTSAADGVSTNFLNSDTILFYPPALSTAAGSANTLVLSDDATEGALLTAANSFSANAAAIKAPNATNTLRIGKYGNLALAGTALNDRNLLSLAKTDYNETAACLVLSASLGNTNVGSGGVIAAFISSSLSAPCSNAAASTTNSLVASTFTLSAGNTSNNNFLGSLIGHRFTNTTLNTQTAATAIPSVIQFQSSNNNVYTRVALTDKIDFQAQGSVTLLTSATLTNHYGFKANAQTAGTNRVSFRADGMTTGTPTVSIGLDVGSHSVGTNRWGVRAANKIENTATDFIASTAAKGFICVDAAGTPHFWRYTVGADGIGALVDTGTTAPTT